MSLLNNMLKNLDARKKKSGADPLSDVVSAKYPKKDRRFRLDTSLIHNAVFLRSVSALTVLLCVTLFFVFRSPAHPVKVVTSPVPKKLIARSLPEAVPVSPPKPIAVLAAQLSDITLNASDDVTTIDFMLNERARYNLNKKDHVFTLTLLNADASQSLDELKLQGGIVASTKVSKKDNNLIVAFQLNDAAKVQQLQYVSSGRPRLLMVLEARHHRRVEKQKTSGLVIKKTEPVLTPLQKAEQQYAKAMRLANEGNIDESIKELKTLLIRMPEYNPGRHALIVILLKQGEMADANWYLLNGLEKSPAYIPFVILKTQYLIHEGKWQDAFIALSSVLPDKENRINYYALSGVLNLHLKHYEAAKNSYQKLLRLQPVNNKWWIGLGIASQALGDMNRARDAFGRAKASGGTDLRLQSYLSNSLAGDAHAS